MICLMPNCAYISETSRMISIHRALAARGGEVCVATHGGTHERLLRDAGVPYEVVGPPMDEARCRRFVENGAGMGPIGQSFYDDDEMRAYVRAEVEHFARRGVRVVVTGFTMTATLSARLAGATLVTEHAGAYVPPVWERGLVEAPVAPIIPALRFLPKRALRFWANLGGHRSKVYLSGFHRVGDELGLPRVPSFAALMLGDLALVTEHPEVLGVSREELDGWRPRGPGYWPGTRLRYTGPIYAELALPVPERVRRFVEGPGPLVYVAITSSPRETVRAAVRELARLDARLLVAATVHRAHLADLETERIMIEGVLPSHELMPRADLAVIAGGQGSVQCAVASGVPIVGVPLQPEQDLNLALLEKRHVARRIAPRHVGTRRLLELAREVLFEPRFRQGARRLQALYREVDGPGASADALLAELGARAESPPGARASA